MMESHQFIDVVEGLITTALSNVHTVTIARVTAVRGSQIDCQPVIARDINGEAVELPVFVKVPLVTLQGGGSYHAFPVAVDDYCLLIVCERCFDRWYSGQDGRRPAEARMHDYSDGFALVGVNPLSGAIEIPQVIQQTGDTNQDGNYTHQGNRTHTGDYTQEGNYSLTGDFTHTGAYNQTGDQAVSGNQEAASYSVGGTAGWSGSFATGDSRTVTVVNGIITQVM